MVWPLPSFRPSKLIETPEAWPVITTWKASNSFFAAARLAAAVAPAGGWTEGRIFCAAGATQTWAADAEPAASKATNRGRIFTAEPPWLAASRKGGCCPFRLANSGGVPLIAQSVCGSMPKQGRLSVERGLVRRFSYLAAPLPPGGLHGVDSLQASACAGFIALRSSQGTIDRIPRRGAGARRFGQASGAGADAKGPSTDALAHCALAVDVLQRTPPGVVAAARRCIAWLACRQQPCSPSPKWWRAGGKRKRRPGSPSSPRCSPAPRRAGSCSPSADSPPAARSGQSGASRSRCERADRRVAARRPFPGRRHMDLARAGGLPGGSGAGIVAAPDLGRDADRRGGGARGNAHRTLAREMGEPDRGARGPAGAGQGDLHAR